MEHIIFVNGTQSAVITVHHAAQYTVVAYVEDVATVTYETTTEAEAERWAKATIAYPF